MRYTSFRARGRDSYGIALANGVYDLGARFGAVLPDLKAYLSALSQGLALQRHETSVDFNTGEFTYLPVIANPGKILCIGLNYEEHRKETGRPEAEHPAIFTRFADTLIGHEQPILMPTVSTALDYEGELAVVIGQPGFRIPQERALDHVAGYACFNDATLRDWQRHTHQFTPGKNFPGTGPFGPELVTPDEAGDLGPQPIETRVDGRVVQSATLGDMIFDIPRLIAYVSAFTPLTTGDVIATGTPGGVGFKRQPPQFLKVGETVTVTIGTIGHLSNGIAAEAVS